MATSSYENALNMFDSKFYLIWIDAPLILNLHQIDFILS